MTLFRPCIDLHQGRVKQIVGGTLSDQGVQENYVSEHSASWFAGRYQLDGLFGGHVISLGPGNDAAATAALAAYPGGLQMGGGITTENAQLWIRRGASHVIVTSYLFAEGQLSWDRVKEISSEVGAAQLVIDLSCRRTDRGYFVTTERWQKLTESQLGPELLENLSPYCSEFLVHAADVEGLCQGIDEEVLQILGQSCPLPCTYAGGGRSLDDLNRVSELSEGRVDLTFGSALDLFGGNLVRYEDCVAYNRNRRKIPAS